MISPDGVVRSILAIGIDGLVRLGENLPRIGYTGHECIGSFRMQPGLAMDELDDLGPLPVSDESSVLQAESFKALENALPTGRFVLREEPQPDAGVDRCVELRIDGRYTGMRAHVQVKARAETKANADGSVSYPADVSNLNYLLNGSSPLYVVYLADRRELRYAWVRDEVRRIRGENAGWMRQKTVVMRFTASMDEVGLQDIHSRIRREAKLEREIQDVLSRADVTETVLHVNVRESKVMDPDELRDLLLRGGLTLISSGEAGVVLELLDKLNFVARRLPRLLLVRAFAECSLGRYQLASGHLAEASLVAEELSESDRQFLGFLRTICDYQAGRITRAEFARRQNDLSEEGEGEFGLALQIDSLWESIMTEGTRRGIDIHLPKLKDLVALVLDDQDASETLRLHARTALLYGEGVRYVQRYTHETMMLRSRSAMGRPIDVEKTFGDLNADQSRWSDQANALVEDALKCANPHLVGDACYTRSFILFVFLNSARVWLKPETVFGHMANLKAQVIPDLRRAIQCYEQSGHVEWELRAKILLADVSALTGDEATAKEMAEAVLPVAEAYQFDKIAKEARDHLAGDPFFRQMERQFLSGPNADPDVREAGFSDEDIERIAEDMLAANDLPKDRLAVMVREVMSFRDIARERIGWCRHIQLIQDLGHTRSPATYYAYDPERSCYCEKFRLTSKIGSTDWQVVIETFKNNYCSGCPARSPKGEITPCPSPEI